MQEIGTKVLTRQLMKEVANKTIDDAIPWLEMTKLSVFTSNLPETPEALRTVLEIKHPSSQYQERRQRLFRESQRITEVLLANGIKHAFFKGACLLAWAPDYIREMSDLDVWLWGSEDIFRCWECLNTLGFHCTAELEGCWVVGGTKPACHLSFASEDNAIYLDLHVGQRLSFMGPAFEAPMQPVVINGVACLPLEESALLTLAHCATEGQIGLRDLLDFAVFLACGASLDRLQQMAQRSGLRRVMQKCLQTILNDSQDKAFRGKPILPRWRHWYWRCLWHLIDLPGGHLLLQTLGVELWYLEAVVEGHAKNNREDWRPCPMLGCELCTIGKVTIFAKDSRAFIALQGLTLSKDETCLYDTIVGGKRIIGDGESQERG